MFRPQKYGISVDLANNLPDTSSRICVPKSEMGLCKIYYGVKSK